MLNQFTYFFQTVEAQENLIWWKRYTTTAPTSYNIMKNQKYQVNLIFPSTFWTEKDRIFHLRKVRNKTFPIVSKRGIPC